ncbi:MAG TPA: indole-3-glycerol phosphate synthase TrpC [Planktothrix sp.]|jgi:indole-3-glycerol phosphate synthase/phosphoribosylanthranilate isomerase
MPGSRLDEIVENKKREVAFRKEQESTSSLEKRVQHCDQRFLGAINERTKINLIAELKPKSPSAGALQQDVSVDDILGAYQKYASAISVLTDEKYFGGSLQLLAHASTTVSCPTLCKDFIIDPHQCFEARLSGAGAALLIVKILERRNLFRLHSIINDLGMVPVVEVQTEEELDAAVTAGASVILINNRDLTTFATDLTTTERLAPMVPSGKIIISASGIEMRADIDRLQKYCHTFLIGSSLMRADNLEEKLAELSGRKVIEEQSA